MADQLFNDNVNVNPQATPGQDPSPIVNSNNLFTDQLAAIKNEDGAPKYDTVEKAIEALQHSQQYIPELKGQMTTQASLISELQAKLEARENVQELINKQTPPVVEAPTSNPSLSEQDVATLVSQEIEKRNAQSAQSTNATTVQQALTTKFGSNAQAEIVAKAQSLGMKPSELGALSKTNPAMVLALFGEKQTGSPSPSTNSFNLPLDAPRVEELKRPEKSLLSGSTTRDTTAFMAKVKEAVYKKHGINQ